MLAEAIDDAFARWDRSHLHEFTFPASGKRATERRHIDLEEGEDVLDADRIRVADVLALGQEFSYTLDLGDNWRHHCQVGQQPINPDKEVGLVPDRPLPYWGWGSIPDRTAGCGMATTAKALCRPHPNHGRGPTPPAPR